jgi:hypothetical protein
METMPEPAQPLTADALPFLHAALASYAHALRAELVAGHDDVWERVPEQAQCELLMLPMRLKGLARYTMAGEHIPGEGGPWNDCGELKAAFNAVRAAFGVPSPIGARADAALGALLALTIGLRDVRASYN